MKLKIGKDGLAELFSESSSIVHRQMTVYLIGGGAMCFRNQKNATKDVDLILASDTDYHDFSAALGKLGYLKQTNASQTYKKMETSGIWVKENGGRFDLFVRKVCNALELSQDMVKRSELLGRYGNLEVRMLSNEDIILFKGITERFADTNDIAQIIRTSNVDWKIIENECIHQSSKERWFGALIGKFDDIEEKHGITIPIYGRIQRLWFKDVLREAYERREKEGKSHDEIVKELIGMGFTREEITAARL